MDIILLLSLAGLLLVLIVGLTWFGKRSAKKKVDANGAAAPRGQQIRRAAGVRGVRQRRSGRPALDQDEAAAQGNNEEADDEGQSNDSAADLSRLGTKKRAKLEAKAEKKAQREIAERDREDRKRREHKQQEERDRQNAKEQEEERKREEAEKAAREEKERREHEEYLKMKEAFSVEQEGFEENDEDSKRNLLQEFVDYIKANKVVVLEDLAAHFGLKSASAIERVQQLQEEGILSGVIDDRGKFIYISPEELKAVAKFVKQRGRVSLDELQEHSNTLINLNPGTSVVEAR